MRYHVVITVKDVEGQCPLYQVGDKIIFEDFYLCSKDSKKVCIHAFAAMLTLLSPFLHGSSAIELGIGQKEDVGYFRCPDPGLPYTKGGTVTFQLKREAIKNG